MDYASPSVQLLGLGCSILVCVLAILASVLFLRERAAGPWLMLAGGVSALVGTAVPQGIYLMENAVARSSGAMYESEIVPKVQSLMYLTVWDWLSPASWLLFSIGLVMVALRRRALGKRISELETLLSARDPRNP